MHTGNKGSMRHKTSDSATEPRLTCLFCGGPVILRGR